MAISQRLSFFLSFFMRSKITVIPFAANTQRGRRGHTTFNKATKLWQRQLKQHLTILGSKQTMKYINH